MAFLAAMLLVAAASSPAKSKAKTKDLTGTWFLSVPSGLTSFYNFHQHGTVSGAISSGLGGPPRPGMAKSADHGMWRRVGGRFESAVWRFNYDIGSGDAVNITRIRFILSLDGGFILG